MNAPLRSAAAVTAAALLGFAGSANADSISFMDNVDLQSTNWDDIVELSLFDPALGTLDSVEFKLTGEIAGSAAYENLITSPVDVSLNLAAEITLTNPNDDSDLVVVLPLVNIVDQAGPFDGIIDFDGDSGGTFDGLMAEDMDSALLSDAATLAFYTGPGSVLMPVSADGASTCSGSGGLVCQFMTQGAATVMVTYNFTPVPIPGALVMLLSALSGLGFAGLRRKAARA